MDEFKTLFRFGLSCSFRKFRRKDPCKVKTKGNSKVKVEVKGKVKAKGRSYVNGKVKG